MIGSTLAGRYQVQSQIGIGGMGIVYQAMDTRLMRPVALKLIAPHLMQQESARSRFLREAQALAGLTHPNIVTVFDLAEDEATGSVFIVMELLSGHTLRTSMSAPDRPPFSRVLSQVCRALELAHSRGILHRDIKPENIFVCNDGTLKLMDFGLARLLGQSSKSQSSMVAGTVSYMAPEQLKGDPIDERTDLYALGILLYEYLCGHPPFQGDHPGAILLKHLTEPAPSLRLELPDISPEIDDIILRLLEKRPADRFPSAAALRQEFERPLSEGETTYATLADRVPVHKEHGSKSTYLFPAGQLTALEDTRYEPISEDGILTSAIPTESGLSSIPPAVSSSSGTQTLEANAAAKVPPRKVAGSNLPADDPSSVPGTIPIQTTRITKRIHWKPTALVLASMGLGALGMFAYISSNKSTHVPSPRLRVLPAGSSATQRNLALGHDNTAGDGLDPSEYDAPIDDNVPSSAGQSSKFDEIVQENEQIVSEDEKLRRNIDELKQLIEKQNKGGEASNLPTGIASSTVQNGKPGITSALSGSPITSPAAVHLWPHAEFQFTAWKPIRTTDGNAQVSVRSASECYIYFYAVMEKQNRAILLRSSVDHLPAASQRAESNTIDLRGFAHVAPGSDKIIVLASIQPLRGMPQNLPLPNSNSEIPLDDGAPVSPAMKRFNAWHEFRDQVVNTLHTLRVRTGGHDVALDSVVLRILRIEPLNGAEHVLDDAAAFKF